ncbi:MAG: undecaprenyldiphospho-muramoylpentapeptide beta-N-acetylglucosaminyltransferase [candidate division Zixibacteria bacterium]|nr:undecaprenyldiphospho-muramoylpentapeptide beta-N-acetylglucosaminyltransferase [candidate division Zixibacteria bacterium]MDH3939311.1 undecaprenyldiphospho-muramoylpentapeptide beta-N-acetylglucosaminyltransferase [candidate division Zixibacteria bacterium]MDH4033631.1 undecaprenyldiphospho-muramoylpentapeptide beta-N-acetylglucosaminyltransferase [candidate division Zixibacteria bacterium]
MSGGFRILFAGGGTGGHLYPAIAIADRVKEMLSGHTDVEIRFVGTKHGLEYRLRDSLGYPLELINMRGLVRSLTPRNLLLPFVIALALFKASALLRRFAPDVVVGTGGYVSWPVLRVAGARGIPTVLQEQNSYPGIATRHSANRAQRIYLGFSGAADYLKTTGEIMVTGNPVRSSVMGGNRAAALNEFGLDPDKRTILVLGGSQGARAVNQAVLRSLENNSLKNKYQLLWQTGKRDYKDVTVDAGDKAQGCSLFPFAQSMDLVYAAADVAVARAGALSLAELTACGIPAILVPFPHAAEDHQRKNALEFVQRGLAVMVDQNDLDECDLIGRAVDLFESGQHATMKAAVVAQTRDSKPAVDVIAKDIIELIEETRKAKRS